MNVRARRLMTVGAVILAIALPALPAQAATKPGAAKNVKSSVSKQAYTLSWSAAASNGKAISSYQIGKRTFSKATNSWGKFAYQNVNSSTRKFKVGYANGTRAQLAIRARNSKGYGPWKYGAQLTVPTAPSAPTGVSGVRGNAQVTVSWNAPSTNGGSAITSYKATAVGLSNSCSTSGARTCVITGLANATSYTFKVTATNAIGSSAASAASAAVTPATIPDAPVSVLAIPGNRQARVQWQAPDSNGSEITGYSVTSTPAGFSCETANETCDISGLTLGQNYTFAVTATNAVGTSSAGTSAAIVPAPVPSSPRNVEAAIFDSNEVEVFWDSPADDGGSPITEYTVTASPGGQQCSTGGWDNGCVVGGLDAGVTYSFTVRAANFSGYGFDSAPISQLAVDYPSGPSNVIATAANESAVLAWTATSYAGGGTITYKVYDADTDVLVCSTTAVTCTITGLTNGDVYRYYVYSFNGLFGGFSYSNPVVPGTAAAPAVVSATPGDRQAVVTWSTPVNGGYPVYGYVVTASPGGATCSTTGTLSCTVTGLTNGTSYTFSVTATNTFGVSPSSANSAAIIPGTLPGAPSGVSATAGVLNLTVSWTAPSDNGGRAITKYVATAVEDAGVTCQTTSVDPAVAATSCVISGLTQGDSYTFRVVATNYFGNSGNSAASASVTVVDVPGAPTGASAEAKDSSAKVSWLVPSNNGGLAITGYTVTTEGGAQVCTTSGALFCTVSGLNNGDSYRFRVTATNAIGTSIASGWTGFTVIGLP